MSLCLLINLEEKIILTDSQAGTRVEIKPYLRTKSGTPELQFAFDAPSCVKITRERRGVEPPELAKQQAIDLANKQKTEVNKGD